MTARVRFGVVAFVATSFLAFPHVVGGRVVDLGVVMAWLAPASLLLAIDGQTARRAALVGGISGWLAHAAILHWIFVVTAVYGRAPTAVGVIAPIGLALYPAVFVAAVAAVYASLARRGRAGPFVFAAIWVAGDHARHFVFSGFPWGVIGYAQHGNPWLLGLAPVTGVLGLSFVTALGGAALAIAVGAVRSGISRPHRRMLVAGAGVAAALGIGAFSQALAPPFRGGSLRVGVLQGNVDQGMKWSPEFADTTMRTYEDLARRAVAQGARLVVWPETAVPGSVETEPGFGPRLSALAIEIGVPMVVGAVGVEPARDDWRFFDSGYVFDAQGRRLDRYDKAHLVPFGEYLPWRPLLGRFLRAVATGIARDDVTAGPGARSVLLPLDPDGGGPPAGSDAIARGEAERIVRAGIPICYELLFPDLMRGFAGDGGELLLAITNDAWYGRTGAPYQFLAITELRSAESRLWTARAANTGVSAFIDERGRTVAATEIFEEAVLVYDVPLRGPDAPSTFYVRHGDVFAWLCWLGVVVALVASRRLPRGGEREAVSDEERPGVPVAGRPPPHLSS